MILLEPIPPDSEQVFIESLDRRLGSDVIKPLFAYFGRDIYLILSILNGTYKHFPSLKSLRSLALSSRIYTQMQRKKLLGISVDRALTEVSHEVSLSLRKTYSIYEKFKAELESPAVVLPEAESTDDQP